MEIKHILLGAKWCPNCGPTKSRLDQIAADYNYVDADSIQGLELCSEHNVRSLPALLVQRDDSILTDVVVGQKNILEYFGG